MSLFDILGVSEDASQSEIQTAYRQLARQLHPDQHPGATDEEKQRLHDAMARVNDAWSVLQDPNKRARYLTERTEDDRTSRLRPPHRGECLLCGHGPAEEFRFMHQNAWIIRGTRYTSDVEMCRSCALSFGRSKQNRTLWTGWWGIFSFFTNWWVVWTNLRSLSRASDLPHASRVPDVVAPLSAPMPEGKPMYKRSGPWVTALVLLVLVAMATTAEDEPTYGSSGGGQTTFSGGGQTTFSGGAQPSWRVGSCVTGSSYLSPTSCSSYHSGKIVARTFSAGSCPYSAESYVEDGSRVWCIDDDL